MKQNPGTLSRPGFACDLRRYIHGRPRLVHEIRRRLLTNYEGRVAKLGRGLRRRRASRERLTLSEVEGRGASRSLSMAASDVMVRLRSP